jgi:sirohydrochlorin cobaltochelatase
MARASAFNQTALLLCAHGRGAAADHHTPETLADTLRARGDFAQVETCYLRGEPGVAAALSRVGVDSIVLVPLLMADGHTSQVLLPAALAEAGESAGRVRVTAPVGTSPALAALVQAAAQAECDAKGWAAAETTVLVAGHGTPRHPESGASAERLAARIAETDAFRGAVTAFIEQEPRIEAALRAIRPDPCVVVGFFMDHGGHSADDIPAAIAAAHPDATYTGAIGADPGLADIIASLGEQVSEQ